MALVGGLRLIAGLAFLGVVIALCLWLLSWLFPGVSNTPDSTDSAAARPRSTITHSDQHDAQSPASEQQRTPTVKQHPQGRR